jgi:hypothetical protein
MRRRRTLGILVELVLCGALAAGIVTLALADDSGSGALRAGVARVQADPAER